MTKVTLHYDLDRPLTEEEDYAHIAALHSVYGMVRVQWPRRSTRSPWTTTPRG